MTVGACPKCDSGRSGLEKPPYDIFARTAQFADRCIRLSLALPQNGVAWELQRQLVRSSGSVGANLAERKGVVSKPEFNYKVSIALREAHETAYWLNRIGNAELVPRGRLEALINEADEIVRILTTMLKTGRGQA